MSDTDLHDQVTELEDRLLDLGRMAENCRKLMLGSRLAIAGTGLWLTGMVLGVLRVDPLGLVMAIAGLLGGIVFLGSNRSTLEQIEADMEEAQARRAALIDGAGLREISTLPSISATSEAERHF